MGMNTVLVDCDGCGNEFERHGSMPRRRGMSGINLCPGCKKKADDAYDPDLEREVARDLAAEDAERGRR